MKILAIDDQKLVLIPLENRLKALGYEVLTATTAVVAFFNHVLICVNSNSTIVDNKPLWHHQQ